MLRGDQVHERGGEVPKVETVLSPHWVPHPLVHAPGLCRKVTTRLKSDHFWLLSWLQVPSEPTSWPNVPNTRPKFVRFEVPEMVTQATTRHTNEL